jgi:hypothetical protein
MKGWFLAFTVLAFHAGKTQAQETPNPVDLAYKTRLVGESHSARGDSVFARGLPLTSFGRDRARLEGEARGKAGPISLLVTETVSDQEGARPSSRSTINEAYADFGSGGIHGTVGRKVLSGDVGYGLRPIDVIQREARLQVLPPALEGVDHVSIERFSASSAWSMIIANPGKGRRGDPKDDGSLALRYYQRAGGTDVHGVARFSDRFKLETGAAASAVPHESLELHGSFLYQRRGERLAPLAEPASPQQVLSPDLALENKSIASARKALAGFTWTHASGWSILGETWRDGTAPSAEDWQRLSRQARQRNALAALPGVPAAAVAGSLAASTRMFGLPSLSRRAALTHIAWSDPQGGRWSAAFDALRSLDDGGYSLTAAVGWQADKLRLDAGVRRFGGKPESAYRLLPERGIVFAGASLAF